jgi:hypothetical protein
MIDATTITPVACVIFPDIACSNKQKHIEAIILIALQLHHPGQRVL